MFGSCNHCALPFRPEAVTTVLLQVGSHVQGQETIGAFPCCDEHHPLTHIVIKSGHVSDWTLKQRMTPRKLRSLDYGYPKPCCATSGIELSALIDEPDSLLQVTKIYAEGICCPFEIPVIENALLSMNGVEKVEVAVVTKTVVVQHVPSQTSPAALVAALNEAKLSASLNFPRRQIKATETWIPPWHICLAAAMLIISLFQYFSQPTGVDSLLYLKYVAIGSIALLLPSIVSKALGALRNWVLDIHFLMTLAVAGALALQNYCEAATVVVLFSLADFLESRCTGQARSAIATVLALRPEEAVEADTGDSVPVDRISVGTILMVRSGERVPLDGVVVQGSTSVDESMLTGESMAVTRGINDEIKAGTVNVGGTTLLFKTTTLADDTVVAGMARLVEEATAQQSRSEALVARFAKYYTPLVVLGCLCIAFIPWAFNSDRSRWVYLALQVLVTACPCALVLSTPVTIVSGIARAAQIGVLIKGGQHLETLGSVDTWTLDKTGTLTQGSFQIMKSDTANGFDERELLCLVGSLERGSSHPLAAAIVGRAAVRGVACDASVKSSEIISGSGIKGIVNGLQVCAGSERFLYAEGVNRNDPMLVLALSEIKTSVMTLCLVAVDGIFAGYFAAQDVVRPDANIAVKELLCRKNTVAMLTGDNNFVARGIGSLAGIPESNIHSNLFPQEKLELVSAYKVAAGRLHFVAHVGDGINDAPALAAADVGIAMGVAGSAAALEAGDICLFTNDLRMLGTLQLLARAARTKIIQNVIFSVLTKLTVLCLAGAGVFTLWGAVFVDVGVSLLVTINGLSMLKWGRHHARLYLHDKESAGWAPNRTHVHYHGTQKCTHNHSSHNHLDVLGSGGCTAGHGHHLCGHSHKLGQSLHQKDMHPGHQCQSHNQSSHECPDLQQYELFTHVCHSGDHCEDDHHHHKQGSCPTPHAHHDMRKSPSSVSPRAPLLSQGNTSAHYSL